MESISKLPPQNQEAERAVLGSMLIDKEAIAKVAGIITDEDFYTTAHQRIYKAIMRLYEQNMPVDILILAEAMEKEKVLDAIGGGGYLTALINSVATSANVDAYAQIVKDKSLLRSLIRVSTLTVEEAYKENDNVEFLLDRAEQDIFSISRKKESKDFVHIKELGHDMMDNIEKIFTEHRSMFGLRTGFADFDRTTLGLGKSNLIIIAGRPGMGKTSFALNIATNVATKENKPVLIFSLEMSKEELMLRMLCAEAGIDAHRLKSGKYLSQKVFVPMTNVMSRLSEAPLYISNFDTLNVVELRSKARRFKAEHGLGLIIIDYLQLMTGKTGKVEFRQQDVSDISRGLKLAAKDLDVPVIALSQLSRAPELRKEDPKPRLADLRESGSIEQDADLVIFIYRPELAEKDPQKRESLKEIAQIIIGKNRNGATGEFDMTFKAEFTKFVDKEQVPDMQSSPSRYSSSENENS